MSHRRSASWMIALVSLPLAVGCPAMKTQEPSAAPVSMPARENTPIAGFYATQPGPSDPDAPTEFHLAGNGLKYRILRRSSGPRPRAADTVVVHYRGWLDDGTEFDSSYKRGKAIEFPLRGVIKGWSEGMQYVGEGGKIELEIPYQLGYGADGTPDGSVPPFATLHFEVELLKIK